ncbi:hypothetical protein [Undibacterium flavidum]|uniref:Uncharacterized protein n=1 Tax=Undibacterium flavidum TaxID=2762297 RepID=A0ABR6YB02_9BURK|nr:hypothetical protein [Undibacterium flavidum]MBC3873799.1 hypothetical protein [Undibacterium flavidum]
MQDQFQLPAGIRTIDGDSGRAFSPQAGYAVQEVSGQKWSHIIRVACSVDNLELLIQNLSTNCLPEHHYVILSGHWFGDRVDTYLSAFTPRTSINKVIQTHLKTLIHDGMIGFGFAWYDTEKHEEIFVDDHKIICILTSNLSKFETVLQSHHIKHNDSLSFISEHGHSHINLGDENSNYCHYLIHQLDMRIYDRP